MKARAPSHSSVVLVTGASGALGQVLCRRFVAEGFRTIVTDIDLDASKRLQHELGDESIGLRLDVTRAEDFEAAYRVAAERWGGIGVLVNNAALTRVTPLFDIAAEEFDKVIAVTLKGAFLGCQTIGKHMMVARYGRIINMASLAGQNGGAATGAHYAAAKGGVVTLTKVFARAMAAHGVTVNAVSPGPLDLDSVRSLLSPEQVAELEASIPAGSLGDPGYVADVVALLASRDARSVTGATWDINGGLYLR
jgi:3-oxoacyl-[acyl-carrier protein] reductase